MPKKTNRKKSKVSPKVHKKKEKNLFLNFLKKSSTLTKALIFLGIILILTPTLFYINQTIQLAYFSPKVIEIKKSFASPIEIKIPQVKIDLSIYETAIHNNVWQISNDGVSHLNISARPGERGPIILYAHNTDNRFGPIRWLEVGNLIQIKTTDGKTHNYKIYKIFETNPPDTGFISKIYKETLVLYTCSGFADLKRYFILASPQK